MFKIKKRYFVGNITCDDFYRLHGKHVLFTKSACSDEGFFGRFSGIREYPNGKAFFKVCNDESYMFMCELEFETPEAFKEKEADPVKITRCEAIEKFLEKEHGMEFSFHRDYIQCNLPYEVRVTPLENLFGKKVEVING